MLSSQEVRNVTFSNAMGGYRKDEVDIFLDKVEVDYEKYEKLLETQNARISELEAQIGELKTSQNSIQNVLLSAQKLADQIVDEAKVKSQQIINDAQQNITDLTEKSKMLAGEFDAKATEKKERLENDLNDIIKVAENKKAAVEAATADSVKKQQELFDSLKREMSSFKDDVIRKYKEHLELLSSLPSFAEVDPKTAAQIADRAFEDEAKEKLPETEETEEAPETDKAEEITDDADEISEETDEIELPEDETEDEKEFKSGFTIIDSEELD